MARLPHIRRKLHQHARWLYGTFRFRTGQPVLWDKESAGVLLYHGLTQGPPRRINARFLDLARFESDLQYISEYLNPVSAIRGQAVE